MAAVHSHAEISIHTTAKVVTARTDATKVEKSDFNPHHREGGDICQSFSSSSGTDFNPHHREGGDRKGGKAGNLETDFNPHHREGGDSKNAQIS